MLSFKLLGQTVLSKNGAPLTRFRSQKEAALLIYLAQTGAPHQRIFLADLLWQSSTTKQSLTNLRTALARLRKQIGDDLLVTRKTLALAPESQQQVDSVILLQTLQSIGQIDSAETAVTLQNALDTYHGEFLADFHLTDAQPFTEWVVVTREHIRRQVITAYQKLKAYALSTGDVQVGIAVARRWLAVDELDETAHTLLIQLLLEAGNVQEALAHYDHCVALLQAELGVAPPAKMTALIKAARPKRAVISHPAAEVRHNLPAEYDQFFGRREAQQEIHVRLDQPWCRLVTITGQGGMGKTRLATTIARSRLSQYHDGVWLVALENIDPDDEDLAEAIAVEIATILNLRLTGSAPPAEQLLNHLQHKQMMLVLDNFEHLVAGRQIVLDIVQRCEQVQLIVTSREALRLRAEWTIALSGLSYPNSDTDEMPSEAVALFAARRAQQQHGEISADELAAIRTICRMVAGLPLAIELAAALTHQATVREVAKSLQDGFDSLQASLHDVPDKHRGLHMVFEMSWHTLTPALQQQLARLTVFRGGFTETAARQITAATAQHLAALVNKSLLAYHAEAERYTLHPVIRTYAAEKLSFADPTPQKHVHFFLTLLAQHTKPLQKERPQDSINLLEPDIDNIRRAWQTGLAERKAMLLYEALISLSIYYQLRGLAREGEAIMHATLNVAKGWGNDGTALAIRAGLERARFQNRLGQFHPAIQTSQATLKLARQTVDEWAVAMGHVWWGESLWRLGKYSEADKKLAAALKLALQLEDTEIIGWCYHQLGIVHDIQGDHDRALTHFEQARQQWEALDHAQNLSNSLNSIGIVKLHQGDFEAAQPILEAALELCNKIGNQHVQATILNNLSIIASRQDDYEGANYYLRLGLELATVNGNLTAQAEILNNLGRNYLIIEQQEAAANVLEQGLETSRLIGEPQIQISTLVNFARLKILQGDVSAADATYKQALKIARKYDLKHYKFEIFINMAQRWGDVDREAAIKYAAKAKAVAKSLQNPIFVNRADEVMVRFDMAEEK